MSGSASSIFPNQVKFPYAGIIAFEGDTGKPLWKRWNPPFSPSASPFRGKLIKASSGEGGEEERLVVRLSSGKEGEGGVCGPANTSAQFRLEAVCRLLFGTVAVAGGGGGGGEGAGNISDQSKTRGGTFLCWKYRCKKPAR